MHNISSYNCHNYNYNLLTSPKTKLVQNNKAPRLNALKHTMCPRQGLQRSYLEVGGDGHVDLLSGLRDSVEERRVVQGAVPCSLKVEERPRKSTQTTPCPCLSPHNTTFQKVSSLLQWTSTSSIKSIIWVAQTQEIMRRNTRHKIRFGLSSLNGRAPSCDTDLLPGDNDVTK